MWLRGKCASLAWGRILGSTLRIVGGGPGDEINTWVNTGKVPTLLTWANYPESPVSCLQNVWNNAHHVGPSC